jgi:carbonic anhydrase
LKFQDGSCRTNDLSYTLTNTGVKGSYPGQDICEFPTVEIPGIPGVYQALQFHIHTSSEHTIDGKFFGAELHTVHAEVGGDRYAVVGMMIHPDANEENEMFQILLDGWQQSYEDNENLCNAIQFPNVPVSEPATEPPATITANVTVGLTFPGGRKLQPQVFSPYQLIPPGATFYHYDGGLTTPPCSEVVWWNLADKAVSITPGQYLKLTEHVLGYTNPEDCLLGTNAGSAGSTSRPVQPLNGRTVERICPVDFVDTTC